MTIAWSPSIAPLTMTSSLRNGPNGGEPVIANKPATHSTAVTGNAAPTPRTPAVDLER